MKTNQDLFNTIRELKEEILKLESSLKEDDSFLLVTEKHCLKFYDGFQNESGFDEIFHDYHQGVSKKIIGCDFADHVVVWDRHKNSAAGAGNSVMLAKKRDKETDGNRGRWIGWWDFNRRFENVTIDQFKTLAQKLGFDKLEINDPPIKPYYEPIENFLTEEV